MANRYTVATVLGFLVVLSTVLLGLALASPVAAAPDPQRASSLQPLLAGCGLPGDVALNDGQVNAADLQAVANHWQSHSGGPGWDATYDLVPDDRVDVRDVMYAAQRWGARCVPVSGTLSGAQTWSDPNVYMVTGDTTLQAGAVLTVTAGTVVRFQTGTGLTVNGALVVEGTAMAPVTLTAQSATLAGAQATSDQGRTTNDQQSSSLVVGPSSAPGDWDGLTFGPDSHAVLDHVVVEYGGRGNTQGVYIQSDDVRITNATIRQNLGHGLRVAAGYAPTITNTQFLSNTAYAVYTEFSSTDPGYPLLAGNSGTGNGTNGTRVGGTITGTVTLASNPNLPYVAVGLNVPQGQSLTVQAGVILKLDWASINVNGTLQAQGTSGSPVVFTSLKDDAYGGDTNNDGSATSPAPGDWGAISVGQHGTALLDHAVVRYGGSYNGRGIDNEGGNLSVTNSTIAYNQSYGIYIGDGSLSVTNSTISGNGQHGVYVYNPTSLTLIGNSFVNNANYAAYLQFYYAGITPTLSGNSASGNGVSGIGLAGSMIIATLKNAGMPYVVDGLTVNSGATLTIEAGTVVKFSGSAKSLEVNGSLVTQGTLAQPVYFTSLKDDSVGGDTNGDGNASSPAPGDWQRIHLTSGTANLAHTILRYGGSGGISDAAIVSGIWNSSITMSDSIVEYSATDGVHVQAGYACYDSNTASISLNNVTVRNNLGIGVSATGCNTSSHVVSISNSTITRNGNSGIAAIRLTSTSNIVGSIIADNLGYGVYNNSTIPLNAENNWWGSDSGPAPYGSGNGINYQTCWDSEFGAYYICQFYVDADPWLGKSVFVGSQLGQSGPAATYQARVAEPVNTANGNYSYGHTDLSIPTRSLPLDFARAYNSLDPQPGPLGYGWTYNWNLRLTENTSDNTVVVTFGDGHAEKWTWTGSAYDGAPGVFGALVKNGDGSRDLTQKDQTRYHFTADGRLAWAEDRNGNRTTLAYDAQGRLTTVAEPTGRTLAFAYTSPVSTTLISQVTDHASRTIQFTYNITGALTAVVDVTGQATTMTYDANHRLLTITDANGHTFVRNVYDSNGRVKEQYDALNNKTTFAYDEPAHKTLVTDPRGNVTTYQYDSEWRLTSEKDPLNNTAVYAYDADNNRTQIVDKRGYTTTLAYDDRCHTTVVTDTLGYTRTSSYDSRNNLLSEIDARHNTTSYEYDARSNLTRRTDALGNVTAWTYDSYGQVLSTTDPLTHTTHYAYDPWGHRSVITDTLGNTTTFTYDIAGRKLSDTDARGRVITHTYDAANRLLAVYELLSKTTTYTYDPVGNRTSITNPRGGVTTFAYDAKDRLVNVTDPLSQTTSYGYDAVNNQAVVTNALGFAATYTYDALNRRTSVRDPLGHITSYQYDANSNRTRLTDANGKVTQYAYDALNRLTGVTDAANGTVTYTYDANGNRTSMTDANVYTTAYTYDALNRLVSVTDPLSHTVTYAYDAVGNRTRQTKADDTVISYTYNALDRLTQISYPGGTVGYAYDAVGNRAAMTDTVGVTGYAYDDLDRLIQVVTPNSALTYTYDLNDNRTGLAYPDGKVITYTYDLADRLTTVTDWAGRVTTYSHDVANRQTAVQYPNTIQATYAYDNADRLLSLAHTSPVSGTVAVFTYTLDAVGNRLTMQDLDGTTSYAYDSLYRLTQVTYPNGEAVSYAYDPMGNRTAMTSTVTGAITYTYDAGDRLPTAGGTGGSETRLYTWDANGNMTGKGSAIYTYDALDRLTQVVSGTTTVQFTYNGDGVRLGKTVNGTATAYVQDVAAPLPVALTETTGGQTSRYVYGNDLLAQVDPAGNPLFYHSDGLGSTRALSNLAGQRTDTYSYDVFGAVRSHTGSAAQPFTFSGEQADGELGLVFLRARYYDPQVGRFVTRDRHPGSLIAPQSLHKYVYAQNNPVLLSDDDGQFVIPLLVIGIVGYSAYQAWDNFLDRANQMETNMRGYYEFDFENPEWQRKYENYNPAKDYASTLAAGVHAGVSTPGTSLSGPPPGITGSIGVTSLITTVARKFMNWLFGFKGPEPYRFEPGQEMGQSGVQDYEYWFYSGGGAWGGPPSGGK